MTQVEFNQLVAIWLRRGTWTPKEAARLLSEQTPHRPEHVSLDAPETGLAWHILDLMLTFPEFRNERTPSDWIGWAVGRQLHINPAFQHHAKPTPAQSTATPVPDMPVAALGEAEKAGPVVDGLPTKEIATIFDGVNGWEAARWPKNLSSSKWLHPARIAMGCAGGASAVWNPLTLAQLMHSKKKGIKAREQVMKTLNSRFTRNPVLTPWRDAFNEYFSTHCTID